MGLRRRYELVGNDMRFLIAGYGSIGKRHVKNLIALGQTDLVFYRSHKSTLEDDLIEGFPVETDLQSALDHDPDAVIISNPTALHMDVALPAAKNGCDIFIEKPLSDSMEKVEDLRAMVNNKCVQVLIGFQFRFHPNLIDIKKMLEHGMIGKVLSVRSHWGEFLPDWHPWEDYRDSYSARKDLGGGVVLTLCHPIDYVRWLFGEVIDQDQWSLVGYESELDIDVEDTAEIGLRTKKGAIISIHLDFNQKPPSHRMEIIGTGGTIRWDYYQSEIKYIVAGQQQGVSDWKTVCAYPGFARNDLFVREMDHFLDVVQRKKEPVCDLDDGIKVLEISLRALQSGNMS